MLKRICYSIILSTAALFVLAGISSFASRVTSFETAGKFSGKAALHENKNEFSDSSVQKVLEDYRQTPLSFEANLGQSEPQVEFISRGNGYALFLTRQEAVIALQKNAEEKSSEAGRKIPPAKRQAVLRMKLDGGSSQPQVSGQNELAAKSNYFNGSAARNWRADVPNYSRVLYKDVYPGIDQVFYGNGRELEYDFIVAPEADAGKIAVRFEGADKVEIADTGELVLHLGDEQIRQKSPVIYQETGGEKKYVAGNYVSRGGNKIGFELGEYDRQKPLVIDPVLIYSTYLGGNGADQGNSVAFDGAGNAYITGLTWSTNFPLANPLKSTPDASRGDVFVTKINAAGNAVIFSTYIGGSFGDIGHSIDVDNAGNVYVAGVTGASPTNDFPTVNAFDSSYGGTDDAFLLKLNPNGNQLLYSTYLGGSNTDVAFEVRVNRNTQEVFLLGNTLSVTEFPTTPGAFQTSCQGCVSSPFVTKFNAQGSALVYSTLFGAGTPNDLAIDGEGNAYLTGTTTSQGFPITPGAAQTVCRGCELLRGDAFVTKLNSQGSGLVYSTFLGGSLEEVGNAIAVDAAGNAYVTGHTTSNSNSIVPFPTTSGVVQPRSDSTAAFVTKVNATGTSFLYSTFLGGQTSVGGLGIAVDRFGRATVTGATSSQNFPYVKPLLPPSAAGGIFVTTLNTTASAPVFSTFIGGGEGRDVVTDNNGNLYVTGFVIDNRLLTANALQFAPGGGTYDAFVTKIQNTFNDEVSSDFDGDGKTDVAVFRPSDGTWYILRSSDSQFQAARFGQAGDVITPGDFDGDEKTDAAVFRDGVWYIFSSSTNQVRDVDFGRADDKPVVGDYDGDRKADVAVFRNGTWFWLNSSNNEIRVADWGLATDLPTPGDYDGDGRTDPAVFRPSNGTWYVLKSTDGNMLASQFGANGDKPVAGDYDGDGKTDFAVYRPSNGTWYIQQSRDGFRAARFGLAGDVPSQGDFDGDGRTDFAVFRPSNGTWYVLTSGSSSFSAMTWGLSGDVTVQSGYNP